MNIRVDLNTPIKDGTEVVFRSPVDCSQVTGLIVYYSDNGNTASKEFSFADAHGYNVGNIDHLFAENVVVKVILDVTTSMAFVQNADTNTYLEWRFKDTVDKLAPAFEESGAIVTCEPVEGYPLSVVSQIAPTDKGCTSVTLWRCGKNLCTYPYTHDDVREAKVWTDNGVTRTINDDGSITFKGTATATMYKPRLSELKTGLEGTRCSPYTYYDPNNGIFHILIGKGQTVDTTIYPQIEYGTVSTDYEPYRGDKFTVNFGRTVYGGSFDWKTGVLTTDEGEKIQYEAQEILALSGINTLYCDTGDITVSGRSDTTAVIDELTNAIIGLGGNPSGGSVGTTDHSKLTNRYAADAHPIDSITGLREALNGIPTDEHISGLIDGAMEELPSVDLTNYYTKPETDKAIEDALADLPTGGGGFETVTLWSGAAGNTSAVNLVDSFRNYRFLIAIAGITGVRTYQFSGIFDVLEIPRSTEAQAYLSTPFEMLDNGTIKNCCGAVLAFKGETSIEFVSRYYGNWRSACLFRLIGVK